MIIPIDRNSPEAQIPLKELVGKLYTRHVKLDDSGNPLATDAGNWRKVTPGWRCLKASLVTLGKGWCFSQFGLER